jgi:hypothetical protein
MENGQLSFQGNISEAVNYYLQNEKTEDISYKYTNNTNIESQIFLNSASIIVDRIMKGIYRNGQNISLELEVKSAINQEYSVELLIKNSNLEPIAFSPLGFFENGLIRQNKHNLKFNLHLKLPFLASGSYFIDIMLVNPGKAFYEYCENCLTFEVDSNYFGISNWDFKQSRGQGSILLEPSIEILDSNNE